MNNIREEMTEIVAVRLAQQSGIGDQANPVGPYYRALAEEIVRDLIDFFRERQIILSSSVQS